VVFVRTIAGRTNLATDPLPDVALDILEALARDATLCKWHDSGRSTLSARSVGAAQ
jgi:hypothetical protein